MRQTLGMTTQLSDGAAVVPEWDLHDRMLKALQVAGIGVAEMAEQLGVSRASVGRWLGGRALPKRATLLAWAAVTNVDLDWLEFGEVRHQGLEPRTRCYGGNASDQRVLTLAWSVKPGLTQKLRSPHRPTRHLSAVS